MSTSISPTQIASGDTGAMFSGTIIMAMLYGITTLQTYSYFVFYPKDPTNLKTLVCIIWVMDTLHVAFVSRWVYYFLLNPVVVDVSQWTLLASFILNVVMSVLVQAFYTFQIFHLSNAKIRWWLTPTIGLAVLAHLCFGIEIAVLICIEEVFNQPSEMIPTVVTPFAVTAFLSDIFIALALCILLHGSRTGFGRTNALVSTLIVYAINRCLLTLVVGVGIVVTFAVSPTSLWPLAIINVLGQLYATSLLATLNSRHSLRVGDGSSTSSVRLSGLAFEDDTHRANTSLRGQDHILQIRVETVTEGGRSSMSRSALNTAVEDQHDGASKTEASGSGVLDAGLG